ncbi:MAG: hypothetical protein KIG60_01050 [Caryophanon sp.]|nr:hypothetical protein [Caryophanon sp.]
MSLVIENEGAVDSAEGTVFGAQTGPRTIGDLLGESNDLLPLYRGGAMIITAEEELPVAP